MVTAAALAGADHPVGAADRSAAGPLAVVRSEADPSAEAAASAVAEGARVGRLNQREPCDYQPQGASPRLAQQKPDASACRRVGQTWA